MGTEWEDALRAAAIALHVALRSATGVSAAVYPDRHLRYADRALMYREQLLEREARQAMSRMLAEREHDEADYEY